MSVSLSVFVMELSFSANLQPGRQEGAMDHVFLAQIVSTSHGAMDRVLHLGNCALGDGQSLSYLSCRRPYCETHIDNLSASLSPSCHEESLQLWLPHLWLALLKEKNMETTHKFRYSIIVRSPHLAQWIK